MRDLEDRTNVYILQTSSPHQKLAGFYKGDRLLLDHDDGTGMPRFKKEDDPSKTCWISLSDLSVAPKKTERAAKKESKMTFKVGDKVRIKADCKATFTDYRRGVTATIESVSDDTTWRNLPIRIKYDAGGGTSCVKAEYLEHVPVAKVTITVSRAEAEAFNACFDQDGYIIGGSGAKRCEVVGVIRQALAEALESEEVRAARALLAKEGYTVTKNK